MFFVLDSFVQTESRYSLAQSDQRTGKTDLFLPRLTVFCNSEGVDPFVRDVEIKCVEIAAYSVVIADCKGQSSSPLSAHWLVFCSLNS